MLKLARRAEPEYELKHRITGAVILVTAAVLIVPFLLSDHSEQSQRGDLELPPQTDSTPHSQMTPLDLSDIMDQPQDEGSNGLAVSSVDEREPATVNLMDPVKAIESDEQGSTAASTTHEINSAVSQATPKPALAMTRDRDSSQETTQLGVASIEPERSQNEQGWFVRVGTFAKQSNVETVVNRLKKHGYQPQMRPVNNEQGRGTRIWLGPYDKRDAADSISERLRELTGEKGFVTRDNS